MPAVQPIQTRLPVNATPFLELYDESSGKWWCRELNPDDYTSKARPHPSRWNAVISKSLAASDEPPNAALVVAKELKLGDEVMVPAIHATGLDGWPYNFEGSRSAQAQAFSRHLECPPKGAPFEAVQAAQIILHYWREGEDLIGFWETFEPETDVLHQPSAYANYFRPSALTREREEP